MNEWMNEWKSVIAIEGEPRTVTAHARFYSPLANGRYVELRYEKNHCCVRQSFTERDSYLYVRQCGPRIETQHQQDESNSYNLSRRTQFERAAFKKKLFELDYNEFRKKNPVKTTVATNAVLVSLGAHLFGSEGVLSNRKIFGLLVRVIPVEKTVSCGSSKLISSVLATSSTLFNSFWKINTCSSSVILSSCDLRAFPLPVAHAWVGRHPKHEKVSGGTLNMEIGAIPIRNYY